jgi:carboxyl-terminal processing protease
VRGEVGTKVALVVRRQGDTPGSATELTIHVVLTEIQTASVEWRLLDDKVDTARIGYIKHTIFSERSPAEMKKAIEELKTAGAKKFIWDLRGNPGGLVDSAIQTADLWLDGGLVLIEERADGTEKRFEAARGDESKNAPLVLLVDGASASASEIVAGALQDNARAILVGVKTFGKGSVQLVHELSDQSSLHVTNAQWFTPNRHQISGQGLTPDLIVQAEKDPLVEAIAELQK